MNPKHYKSSSEKVPQGTFSFGQGRALASNAGPTPMTGLENTFFYQTATLEGPRPYRATNEEVPHAKVGILGSQGAGVTLGASRHY